MWSLHDDWTTANDDVKAQYIYTEANTIGQTVFMHCVIGLWLLGDDVWLADGSCYRTW